MDTYSTISPEMHPRSEEFNPISSSAQARDGDRKVNRRHLKSAYRDAAWRHAFQALSDLEDLEESAATSVIESFPVTALPTPTPLQPTLTRSTSLSPSTKKLAPAYVREVLSPAASIRTERFWKHYSFPTPGLPEHTTPATWRDLSDVMTLEWFHHSLRHTGPVHAFTAQLSEDVDEECRQKPSTINWLHRRIARELKLALGRPVDLWMAGELAERGYPRRLHLHGELQIDSSESVRVRKALRIACGEWTRARQHQVDLIDTPDVVWSHYPLGLSIMSGVVPYRGRFVDRARPINGDWFAATNDVRSTAAALYTTRRKQVISMMNSLPS